jgi:small subunit ribosomal protein S16
MATKIRLQRYGKKGQPFYHIVIADGRAPRDGRFIEQIGIYNPLTIPATIDLNFDKALSWLQKGATPTETAKAILSYKGILYKNHLLKGVAKGALTVEAAEAKFQKWLEEKQSKISSKISQRQQESRTQLKKRIETETQMKEEREKVIAVKRAKLAEKEKEAENKTEEPIEQPVAEEPAAEV